MVFTRLETAAEAGGFLPWGVGLIALIVPLGAFAVVCGSGQERLHS